jgi:integrator complex subunit 11
MFYVRVGSQSVVYTGDYNMTPDRHLGGASIEKLRPNLLITETTYATTIRDSKRIRERDFLKRVHETVEKGGKVLIPVFALGRAQELCILIDAYWERMNLNVPIYFSAGLTEKANMYYKLFINWTNQKIKNTFVKRNMFDFKHIKPFERSFADRPGPMVLFATPGMLHAGTSLEVFKKWCPSENNMCILPGYCVVGTVGNKILTQSNVTIDIDKKTKIDVKCQVKSLSFSAHADAKGIMQLIRQCCPDNVMLVHGEKAKMEFLQQRIINEFKIPCYSPANGCTLVINPASNTQSIANMIPVEASNYLIEQQFEHDDFDDDEDDDYDGPRGIGDFEDLFKSEFFESMMEDVEDENLVHDLPTGELTAPINAVLVANKPLDDANVKLKLLDINEASREIGLPQHNLRFNSTVTLNQPLDKTTLINKISEELKSQKLREKISEFDGAISLRSIDFKLHELEQNKIKMSWLYEDEDLADFILSALNK